MGYILNKIQNSGATTPAVSALNFAKSTTTVTKADLQTLSGLMQTAEQFGLGGRVEETLQKKGEDPKKIYSGGFISDIFDTLNVLQYGVTGVLKGKTFIEGVKTRQSFSDKDALGDNGVPGMIAGIALDIAVDPLTYIPIVGQIKALGKIGTAIKASKVITTATTAIKESKIGSLLGRSFVYRFGQDPIYKEIAERSIRAIGVGNYNMMELAKPLVKLDGATQKVIANARKLGKVNELPEELLIKAKPAFDELDRLGGEAVKMGLLDSKTWEENVGRYIPRLYTKYDGTESIIKKATNLFDTKPLRINMDRFKKRTDIPEDVREAMGEIMEAGYPTAKGLVQINQAVERAKLFKQVNLNFGSMGSIDGLKQLPKVATLGDLAGKYVPAPIFDDIQEIIRPATIGLAKTLVAGFKFNKVILNPSTHARNVMSNMILNDFAGLSPTRLDVYAKAAKSIIKKDEIYKEAKSAGLALNTFAAQELKALLSGPEISKLGKVTDAVKNAGKKLGDLYQKEEEFAKMAQYIFQRGQGKNVDEAVTIAEQATFNYAQVTPFIRRVRESMFGMPFITFTYKATPQVAKTLITKPGTISKYGKIKNAIENQSDLTELTAERALEAPWIRDGFYVRLPWKDEYGRSAYFDMTYILPFGDLISGQLIGRQIKRETGTPESYIEAALQKLPLGNILKELSRNQDFYDNKIWRDSDSEEKKMGDLMLYLIRTYAPPLVADQLPGGWITAGKNAGTRRDSITEKILKSRGIINIQELKDAGLSTSTRTLQQELLKMAGLKITPVDLETSQWYSEEERKAAIKTLLEEAGKIKQFNLPYIPKK